ncbi:MAG: hypothetical protein II557_04905, partial [Clostridia bacterium]|nr:hypothetical protein [Clostridia bacterium]
FGVGREMGVSCDASAADDCYLPLFHNAVPFRKSGGACCVRMSGQISCPYHHSTKGKFLQEFLEIFDSMIVIFFRFPFMTADRLPKGLPARPLETFGPFGNRGRRS